MSLNAKTKLRGLLEIIASAAEFTEIPIRHGEEAVLKNLMTRVPHRPGAGGQKVSFTDPHVKANLMIQVSLQQTVQFMLFSLVWVSREDGENSTIICCTDVQSGRN